MSNHNQKLGGILPAVCTTFAADGALDIPAQKDVIRFALACGANGIVCFGLAGEVNKLTPDERRQLSAVIIEEVAGRVPVLVGVGSEGVHTSKELARSAAAAGADGVVIPPPITSHLGEDGLAPYFRAVADATPLPVVIQDAPAYLRVELSPAGVRHLAEVQPNIKYVKIESGPQATARWIAELAPVVGVLTGNAGLFLPSDIRAGVVGNVPGTELTDLLVAVHRAVQQGDDAAADDLFQKLLPYLVFALQDIDHYNACTKEVLVRRGVLRQGGLRMPGPALTAASLEQLDRFVGALGLVSAGPGSRAAVRS